MPEPVAPTVAAAVLASLTYQALWQMAPHAPLSVDPATPLEKALGVMYLSRLGSLLVQEGGTCTGIFTERDVLCRVAGKVDLRVPIGDVLTRRPVVVPLHRPIAEGLKVMVDGGFRHLPLLGSQGEVAAILSLRDIVRFVVVGLSAGGEGSSHLTVGLAAGQAFADALGRHPMVALSVRPPVCVGPTITVSDAVGMMVDHSAGSALVVEDGDVQGIVTERDVLRAMMSKVPLDHPVVRLMTRHPQVISPTDSFHDCLHMMNLGGFRHMPIVDAARRPVGMVSIRDIARFIVTLLAKG